MYVPRVDPRRLAPRGAAVEGICPASGPGNGVSQASMPNLVPRADLKTIWGFSEKNIMKLPYYEVNVIETTNWSYMFPIEDVENMAKSLSGSTVKAYLDIVNRRRNSLKECRDRRGQKYIEMLNARVLDTFDIGDTPENFDLILNMMKAGVSKMFPRKDYQDLSNMNFNMCVRIVYTYTHTHACICR